MSWKVAKISRYSTLGTISDYVDDVNGFLIRVGFRDPSTGEIYKDTKFTSFVSNLRPYFGRIKIGYYFTSQAINEEEAEEEANYVLNLIDDYQNDFPVFFDIDLGNIAGTGRADGLDRETRYNIYKAFSDVVGNSGFILDYSFQNLIDVQKADNIGATLIRKYASLYPTIDGVTIDGWEFAGNDSTLPGTVNVCPITVFNDIAGWESSGDKPIENYINSLIEEVFTYTGKPIEPEVYNPFELELGIDYTVFYKYNVNVNDADTINQPTVTVYGINSYSGSYSMHFSILPKELTGPVVLNPSSATYTGSPIKPAVKIGNLKAGIDFITQYQDNVNVGIYTVTVKGRKNYTGTVTAKFSITPMSITEDMFYLKQTSYSYTGLRILPEVEIKDSVVGDKYGDVDDGRFDYGDIEDPNFDIDNENLIDYDGGDEDDEEKVKYLGDYDFNTNMLSNFEYIYGQNIDVGIKSGSITIQGINNMTGTVTLYFDIVKDDISEDFILDQTVFEYTGKECRPTVICVNATIADDNRFNYIDESDESYEPSPDLVDVDGTDVSEPIITDWTEYDFVEMSPSLEEGKDYTVEYFDNIEIGQAKVVVSGIYPYTGVVELPFTIHTIDINKSCYTWRLEKESYKYESYPIEPEVICIKDETAIEEDPTFIVEYENNTDFGTGVAKIEGINNFSGKITLYFRIVAGDLSTDCVCLCGEPTEDGLYNFHNFQVYDKVRDRVLVPYEDYYFDNESYYFYYPYNPSYIRVYRKVTGYYNYTGELESIFPTFLDNIEPTVPKIDGISVEILFMNGGDIEEEEHEDPEPEAEVEPYEEDYGDDDSEPSGHSDKWIPTEDLFPLTKDITEDADPTTIESFPPYKSVKLYNCKYYSSPENPYPEEELLSGAYYIYNYHVVENRVRVARVTEDINIPGATVGWISIDDLYFILDGNQYKLGDRVFVLKDIYRYSNGSGGIIAKAGSYMYVVALASSLAWNFGDQDEIPFMTDLSDTDFDFVELAGDTDQDDYSPDPTPEPEPEEDDFSLVYTSDTDFNDWDEDDSPYDFLKLATESTGEEGYAIGLAAMINQTPIGWANSEMISLADN